MNHYGRSAVVAGIILISGLLQACGGGGDSESAGTATVSAAQRGTTLRNAFNDANSATASTTATGTKTPALSGTISTTSKFQLSGSAGTSAVSGQAYSFKPAVANAASSVTFSISNKPSWAAFNSATGALTGTPTAADVGTYSSIVISANDGDSMATLAAFNITVAAIGTHNVVLTWTAPSDNADGTPLVDLTGYKIRYGTSSGEYSQTVTLSNASLDRYQVDNLGTGTYYFTISAYNSAGTESQL